MALSRTQILELTKRLDGRYNSLLEEVRVEIEESENQQYIELIGRVPADIGDQSIGDALADLNLAIIDRHIQELRDIDAAKSRIKNRSYSVCIACGDDIALERLLAYPTARRCLLCQRQRERTYAHEATPTL